LERLEAALHDMDRALERYLPAHGGVFVEAGANDGYQQSNTYFLERARGWRGVLVEPIPELARAAERERPRSAVYNCALVASDYGSATVALRYGGLLTTVEEVADDRRAWVAAAHAVAQEEPEHEFETPARTLSSVLDEAGITTIDFLSLDVEGYEPSVLRGLDFERHAPAWLLLEAHDDGARRAIEAELGARYSLVDRLSPLDLLYSRSDLRV
jgi:FkbM family methyltransferase